MKKFINRVLDWMINQDHPLRGSICIGIILTTVVVLLFLSLQYFDTIVNFIHSIPIQARIIFAIFVTSTVICRIELY